MPMHDARELLQVRIEQTPWLCTHEPTVRVALKLCEHMSHTTMLTVLSDHLQWLALRQPLDALCC